MSRMPFSYVDGVCGGTTSGRSLASGGMRCPSISVATPTSSPLSVGVLEPNPYVGVGSVIDCRVPTSVRGVDSSSGR
jgi:hypothetical protein